MGMVGIDYEATPPAGATGDAWVNWLGFEEIVNKTNANSRDDAFLDRHELRRLLFESDWNYGLDVSQDLTEKQMTFIMRVYGNGHVVSKSDIIENMVSDGFLNTRVVGASVSGVTAITTLNFDSIRGDRIANAIFAFREWALSLPDSQIDPYVKRTILLGGENFTARALENTLVYFFEERSLRDGRALFIQDHIISIRQATTVDRYGSSWDVLLQYAALTRADLAAMFDAKVFVVSAPVGIDRASIDYGSGDIWNARDPSQVTNYIMRAGDRSYDGRISAAELANALKDFGAHSSLGANQNPPTLEVANQLVRHYAPIGQNSLSREDIDDMFADGVLRMEPRFSVYDALLTIHPENIPAARIVDRASVDDDMLDRNELKAMFDAVGKSDVTLQDVDFLINIYGNGSVVAETDILNVMRTDGFLRLNGVGGNTVVDWSHISPERMGSAMLRIAGDRAAWGDTLPASRFSQALQRLFGKPAIGAANPVTSARAQFLVRAFGTYVPGPTPSGGGRRVPGTVTVTADQIANMFRRGALTVMNEANRSNVSLGFNMQEPSPKAGSADLLYNYFRSYSYDGNSYLTSAEMTTALNAFKAGDTVVNPRIMRMLEVAGQTLAVSDGRFSESEIRYLSNSGMISLGTGAKQGLRVNLSNITNTDLYIFVMDGKHPMTAADLRSGMAALTGQANTLSAAEATWLVNRYGTRQANGAMAMWRGNLQEMFENGTLSRTNTGSLSTYVSIRKNFTMT